MRLEIQNSRTVHFLLLKEFVNKLTMHGIGTKTLDMNTFHNQWCWTDKAKFSSLVVGRDIN
jgi:hypothetical protein